MAVRNKSADNAPLVSRSAAYDAVAKGLRNEIGRGKRYSVKEASNHTGVPDRAIECAKLEQANPDWRPLSLEQILSLSSFLGPIFTSEWLSEAQQGAFWLVDDEGPAPGEIAAENAEDNAEIAKAARDGIFDDEEKPKLRPVGLRMIERGTMLASLAA